MNPETIQYLEGMHRHFYSAGKHEGQRMCTEMGLKGMRDAESVRLFSQWRDENEQLGDEYKRRLRARFLSMEKQIEALRAELKQYQHELDTAGSSNGGATYDRA